MPRSPDSLALDDAKRMLSAAEAKAVSLGIAYNVAVVDAGGHLLALCPTGRRPCRQHRACNPKAVTARIFWRRRLTTSRTWHSRASRCSAFMKAMAAGLSSSAEASRVLNGSVVGAVGASAGSIEQDVSVAEAAYRRTRWRPSPPIDSAGKDASMKAARIHEYGKPVVLEDVPIPDIEPDEILVQVKACGMCRSDAQLIDGYFRPFAGHPDADHDRSRNLRAWCPRSVRTSLRSQGSKRAMLSAWRRVGAMAFVAIASWATPTSARTCVGRVLAPMADLPSTCRCPRATLSRRTSA